MNSEHSDASINELDPSEKDIELQAYKDYMNNRERELDKRQQGLDARERELDAREHAINNEKQDHLRCYRFLQWCLRYHRHHSPFE